MTDKVELTGGGRRGLDAACAGEGSAREHNFALMSPSESCEKLAEEIDGMLIAPNRGLHSLAG